MTTESTTPLARAATGEPMPDLIEALDKLAARSNSTGDDWIPIREFYKELNRIHAEACRRLGEPPQPARANGVPEPSAQPSEEDLEDALAFWMLTRAKVENHSREPRCSNEAVWAEFEDELSEYETAFADYARLPADSFRAAFESKIGPRRNMLGVDHDFSTSEARSAFDLTMADCLSALAESQGLTVDQFHEALEPRVAEYRAALNRDERPNRTLLLAQAVAHCTANLTEISASDDFPAAGLMGSAAWSVAAYELALAADATFPARYFWRVFDSEINEHVRLLAEHQVSRR